MEWKWGFRSSKNYKSFLVEMSDVNAINIDCWKRGGIWVIDIMGWNIANYSFKWRERFNERKVLAKVENIILNVNAAKLAVFNRLFEEPK